MASKITVQQLREKFPEPISSDDSGSGGYCVGGALAEHLHPSVPRNRTHSFPEDEVLAAHLQEANPSLLPDVALNYADQLISANDNYDFETAWETLGEALFWEPTEET